MTEKSDKPHPDDPEQFQRFQEAAKEHGVDTSKAALDRALAKIVPAKKGPRPKALPKG
jgi:hypothetical protein